MAVVTIDSGDTAAVLADAGITLEEKKVKAASEEAVTEITEGIKEEPKAEENPDEVEGEDGLTPRQKREMTTAMQKAIGKKHRMLKEAEEFAAAQYNERKLAETRAEKAERAIAEFEARNKNSAPVQADTSEKPDRHNFSTESEYIDAMIQYGVDTRLREKAAEEERLAAARAQEKVIQDAQQRINKASELVPDFTELLSEADVEVPPAIAGYMQKSELIAELGYHFAKNPDILTALKGLPPDEQLVKLGKIESKLEPFGLVSKPIDDVKSSSDKKDGGATTAKPSEGTGMSPSKLREQAPVITPLEGAGSSGFLKDPRDMNVREAIADYAKKNRVNLTARQRH